MYIESTNNDKTEYAIHASLDDVGKIYEGLISIYNAANEGERKKQIARQIIAIRHEMPFIRLRCNTPDFNGD